MGICSAKDDSDEADTNTDQQKQSLIKEDAVDKANTNKDTTTSTSRNVIVSIQWCGGWGYAPKFKAAKQLILKKFPENVEVVSKKDATTTGNFEVTVNGTLVHSKKTQGHGFLHQNDKQQEVVFAAIS